jgi:transketolase
LREGDDGKFVAAGPVMVSQAWAAADLLEERGAHFGVLALPWLRDIDGAWLGEVAGHGPLVCLDNHYLEGGQGDAVLRALADEGGRMLTLRLGVTSVPACGTNAEVLAAHGLDAAGIAAAVESRLLVRR